METNLPKPVIPKGVVIFLSIWMFLITLFLIIGLVRVWPEATEAVSIETLSSKERSAANPALGTNVTLTEEALKALKEQQRTTMLLILLLGALGAQIHAIQSFADFVGNGSFHSSWAFWYIKRPLIGALVALTAYSAIVGGVMGLESVYKSGGGNLWGLTAICLLSGLYSRMVTDKMYEVFSTLLAIKPENQQPRKDGLEETGPKAPQITKLEPAEASIANPIPLRIHGSGFTATCKGRIGDQTLDLILKSPTELELPVASFPENTGTHALVVTDPATRLTSAPFQWVVNP